MCNACGCSPPDQWSRTEQLKGASRRLRGAITEELQQPTRLFSEDAIQILKFHGVYQQDDRDRRKEARALGLDKHHMMMIRTRVPGGVVSPSSYIAHDDIAGDIGNGTLRLTTRQDFQLHGVLKADLKEAIQRINDGLLTTLGGCGDQERNIMCCPAPLQDPVRDEVQELLPRLVAGLTPTTRAYVEIWLDGELAASSQDEPADELYGEHYLPRKFILKFGHIGHSAIPARAAMQEAVSLQFDIEDELDADIEDEPTVTSPPASVSFDVLPSLSPKPYPELVCFAVALAARPLRC